MTSLNPLMSIGSQIGEVLRAHAGLRGAEVRARSIELLTLVGIDKPAERLAQLPHEVSGGMRQRVMIALALAAEPQLVIADEPTSALDASLARETMEVLSALTANTGAALLIVSHDIALCARYVDHLVVMKNGRVVESMTPAELVATAPGSSYGRGLLDSIPTLQNWDVDRLRTIETNQEFAQ